MARCCARGLRPAILCSFRRATRRPRRDVENSRGTARKRCSPLVTSTFGINLSSCLIVTRMNRSLHFSTRFGFSVSAKYASSRCASSSVRWTNLPFLNLKPCHYTLPVFGNAPISRNTSIMVAHILPGERPLVPVACAALEPLVDVDADLEPVAGRDAGADA